MFQLLPQLSSFHPRNTPYLVPPCPRTTHPPIPSLKEPSHHMKLEQPKQFDHHPQLPCSGQQQKSSPMLPGWVGQSPMPGWLGSRGIAVNWHQIITLAGGKSSFCKIYFCIFVNLYIFLDWVKSCEDMYLISKYTSTF